MKNPKDIAHRIAVFCRKAESASSRTERNKQILNASSTISNVLNHGAYNEQCIAAAQKVLRKDALDMVAAFRAARQVVAREQAAIRIKILEKQFLADYEDFDERPRRVDPCWR